MMGPFFFLSEAEGVFEGVFFGCFSLVPNVFSTCSHQVPLRFPKLFPKGVPNSTSILSHVVLPKVQLSMYINWKIGCWRIQMFLLCNWGFKEMIPLEECSVFQKNCWWANEYGSFKKTKQSYKSTHELIIQITIKYPQSYMSFWSALFPGPMRYHTSHW
jgi:hypothetical protein